MNYSEYPLVSENPLSRKVHPDDFISKNNMQIAFWCLNEKSTVIKFWSDETWNESFLRANLHVNLCLWITILFNAFCAFKNRTRLDLIERKIIATHADGSRWHSNDFSCISFSIFFTKLQISFHQMRSSFNKALLKFIVNKHKSLMFNLALFENNLLP